MQKNSWIVFAFSLCMISSACTKKPQPTLVPPTEIALSVESIKISDIQRKASAYEGKEITLTGVYRNFSAELLQDNFSKQNGKYNFLLEQNGKYLWIRSDKKPSSNVGETVTIVVRILKDKSERYYFKEVVSSVRTF